MCAELYIQLTVQVIRQAAAILLIIDEPAAAILLTLAQSATAVTDYSNTADNGGMIDMSFKRNGRRRDPRLIFGAIFIFVIGLVCLLIAIKEGWKFSWIIISAAVFFISIIMFKNANE